MAVTLHPAAAFTPVAVAAFVLDLSADRDLTSTSGPTGGISARALLVGATAGDVKYKDLRGNTVTQACGAFQRIDGGAQYVFSTANGTTAATVTAEL